VTVPFPLPLDPLVIDSIEVEPEATLAVHVHPSGAVTATLPNPPIAAIFAPTDGVMEYVHVAGGGGGGGAEPLG